MLFIFTGAYNEKTKLLLFVSLLSLTGCEETTTSNESSFRITESTQNTKRELSVEADSGITYSTIQSSYKAEETVSFKISSKSVEGKTVEVKLNGEKLSPVNDTYSFIMPDQASLLTMKTINLFYQISVGQHDQVSLTIKGNKKEAAFGEMISFTAIADDGYLLDKVSYQYNSFSQTCDLMGDHYELTMPSADITLFATVKDSHQININSEYCPVQIIDPKATILPIKK